MFRTAARLSHTQIETLDAVYKTRWPNNENAIKALVSIGFGVNRDRTLELTTSRKQDADRVRHEEKLAEIHASVDPLLGTPLLTALRVLKKFVQKR